MGANEGKEKFINKIKLNVKTAPYYFLLPILVLYLVFMVYPIIDSFILSFQKFEQGQYSFAGLQNYIRLFNDPVFTTALKNTFFYLIIQVPIMVGLALFLAVILEQYIIVGREFFRMSMFLPSVTALVAYALIFKLLLNTDFGMLNYLLSLIGINKVDWLNGVLTAKLSIVLAITWKWTGYNMVILTAGIKGISDELYEAADIDGAGKWQKFRYITIPSLKPVILFSTITSTIGTLQLFDESYILTQGGPDNATITVGHYLYNTGFKFFDFGYAAAISYALVVIILILSIIQMKVTEERD